MDLSSLNPFSDPIPPSLIATDTANMQAGSEVSLFDRAYNMSGSALASGILSVYNTAAHYGGMEKVDVAKWISEDDEEMGAYYRKNRDVADIGGFIATSLIPGGIALKGLQLAKAGTVLGPFSRALGYAESRQAYYVGEGLKELGASGGTVFNTINTNKLLAITWGAADNAISVAAMETAIAATMKQSPLLENQEWTDIFKHTLAVSGVFGVVGGGIGAIGINSIFKTATKDISRAMNEFTAVTRFEGQLTEGDKAYGMLSSMLRLPQVGRNLEYEFKLNGTNYSLSGQRVEAGTNLETLPTKEAMEKVFGTARKNTMLAVEAKMTELAGKDVELGQAFSKKLFSLIEDGEKAGTPVEEIIERLGDHLNNVGKVSRIGADAATADLGVFYAVEKIDYSKVKDINDFLGAIVSKSPSSGKDIPYKVTDRSKVKLGIIGAGESEVAGSQFTRYGTKEDAWRGGADVAMLENGRIIINPASRNIVKTDEPITAARSYFNVRTGVWSNVAFPTLADLATSARPLAIVGDGMTVAAGNQAARHMKIFDDFPLSSIDTLDASARYAWVGAVSDKGEYLLKVVPPKISGNDIPLLERIHQQGAGNWKDVVLKEADGTELRVSSYGDFTSFLMKRKLELLEGFLSKNPRGEDITSLAIKLNAEPSWIQAAIERNFQPMDSLMEGMSIPLRYSLRPQNVEIAFDYAAAMRAAAANTENPEATLAKLLATPQTLNQTQFSVGEKVLPLSANNTIYGQLGFSYRTKVAKDQYEAAFASVMGAEDARKFLELAPDVAQKIADQLGAGAGILKFSNADYGDTLRLWSQYIGQQVSVIGKKMANATLEELQPHMMAVFNSKYAAADLGAVTNALRLNSGKWYFDLDHPFRIVNKDAAIFDEARNGWVWDKLKASAMEANGRTSNLMVMHSETMDFLRASTEANARRIDKSKVLMTARGFNYNYDSMALYVPPVDTARYPFFAFVRVKEGMLGGSSEVSMITAKTAADLKLFGSKVPDEYEVLFSDNIKAFKKAKGEYDYSLDIKEPTVDSTLQRRGVLGDFFPEVRAENVLDDYISWHQKQEIGLVRNAVQTKYAQVFEELRATGKQFEEVGTSKFSGILKAFRSQTENPYEDYIKGALDISKRSEYTLLHEANEFVESLGKTAYREFGSKFNDASKGIVTWQEANAAASRYGIAGPYREDAISAFYTANSPADRSLIKEFVSKANMLLVNFNLRLDWANSLVNIISTPILLGTEMRSIRTLVEGNNELAGALRSLRTINVPGTNGQVAIPSTLKLIADAIKDYWGPEKLALIERYKSMGAIKDTLSLAHEITETLAIKPYETLSKLKAAGDAAIEKGAKITGNEFAEQFTRFISANVMHKLTDPIVTAGKMSIAEQDAYISVFVNRVQGNYLASQRPIAFQGVLGSAVSLFQTYQFNLLQNLFRHIENKDHAAVAVMGGMQAGLYGMNGIPFFEAVNTHLIGTSNLNPGHKDVYSTAPQIMGKELGDWMMYGTASAFPLWSSQVPSLYTRGDINPRHISIIPVTPMDVPAVDGSIRFVTNLLDVAAKIEGGAHIGNSLLEGLEHNSINRPLAGVAQVFQGYSTTSKGSLISASNDFFSISTLSRVAGAKPMDESLALNSLFRNNAYKASDHLKMEALGEVVKTRLRNNQALTDEELHDFQLKAAKAGMRIEQYAETMQRWSKDANLSVVNKLIDQHRSSYSQRIQEMMGGERLRDFRTAASAGIPQPAPAQTPSSSVPVPSDSASSPAQPSSGQIQ